MQELKGKLPIERARMRLRLQLPAGSREELLHMLAQRQASIESQDLGMQTNQVQPFSNSLHLTCSCLLLSPCRALKAESCCGKGVEKW